MLNRIFSHRLEVFVRKSIVVLSISVLVLLSIAGVYLTTSAALKDRDHDTVVEYARNHAAPGQVYLIPIDFERFRLATGLPVFIDWKSFPYRSSEIIEWYERVRMASAYYEARNMTDATEALAAIRRISPITHIIVEAGKEDLLSAAKAVPVFHDREHILARLIGDDIVEQPNALDGE